MGSIQGVLVGLEQPAGVGWRAQQVGALAQGGVVIGGDQDGVAVVLEAVVAKTSKAKVSQVRLELK